MVTAPLGIPAPVERNKDGEAREQRAGARAWRPSVPPATGDPQAKMDRMTIVKINAITVPEGSGDELARRFPARAGAVDARP